MPIGAIHAFRNIAETAGVIHYEMLPACKSEEAFALITKGEEGDLDAFSEKYGIKFCGSPLE